MTDNHRNLLAQALADTQRTSVLRPFTIHDPAVIRTILTTVVPDSPALASWAAEVRDAVDAALVSRVGRATTIPLPDQAPVPVPEPCPLTTREAETLALYASGADQAEIARQLYVSVNTVKTHLRAIRRKLGVERSADAVLIARSAGWIDR